MAHYSPAPTPLGVYILVNQSSSMLSVWTPVEQALVDFVAGSSQEVGISAGVDYFPDLANSLTVCQASAYTTLDVPIAPLPDNELPLIASFMSHGPAALAQTYGAIGALQLFLVDSPADVALSGAITAAQTWQAAQTVPGAKAVVLFVTNGVPSTSTSPACMATLASTVLAAATGLAGNPSIRTYVLGVGDFLTELDSIAQAGGTGFAHIVSSTRATDIVNELVGLRSYALPCQFSINPSWLTSGKVNVVAAKTPAADGGASRSVPLTRVLGPLDCGTSWSWYGADPDRIVICPSTCEAARVGATAAFDVVYGCPTVNAPR